MRDYFPTLNRVPVIAERDFSFRFWMKFTDALEGLRLRRIDEVYDGNGTFLGVVMLDSPSKPRVESFRASLDLSKATLTDKDVQANAGAAAHKRVKIAREKVSAWPTAHDNLAVVISAGRVFQPQAAG